MSLNLVWEFEEVQTWQDDVRQLLLPEVDGEVVRAFLERPPEYVVGDDLSWLDEIVHRVKDQNVDTQTLLTHRLLKRYGAIRAYHGARPENVQSYYSAGLLPLEAHAARSRAKAMFLTGRFPEVDAAVLQAAIDGVGFKLREGRIFFEARKRFLEYHCGHYMLYGSEFLCGVAAHLPGPRDFRQVLKEVGRPTVFVCNVPLAAMNFSWLREFAGLAVEAIFAKLKDPGYEHSNAGSGAGIMIQQPLPGDHIVSHYHPIRIRDPLLGQWVDCPAEPQKS